MDRPEFSKRSPRGKARLVVGGEWLVVGRETVHAQEQERLLQ